MSKNVNNSCSSTLTTNDYIVGNPIGKKTLILTFDGKMEYIILPMLILFLDMWQNTYVLLDVKSDCF